MNGTEPYWIWRSGYRVGYFRKPFDWTNETHQKPVTLKITADTIYEAYLNGVYIGGNKGCAIIDQYEIGKHMRTGRNLLSVRVENRCGCKGLAFEIFDANGERLLVSDENCRVISSAPEGWQQLEFDDSGWPFAERFGEREPWRKRDETPIQLPQTLTQSPLEKHHPANTRDRKEFDVVRHVIGPEYEQSLKAFPAEVVHPVTVQPTSNPKTLILDFGQEIVGYLELNFSTDVTGSIRLLFGETLRECLIEPSPDNITGEWLIQNETISGKTWQNNRRQGFRYVKITFDLSPNILPSEMVVKQSLYAVEYAGFFQCNDATLNQIWQMSRRTIHLCMQNHYLDGIKRDRLMWIGDAYIEALANYYLFGDQDLFRFDWAQSAAIQFRDGAIPAEHVSGGLVMLDYVAWYIIALRDFYQHTGDTNFVHLLFPTAQRAVAFLAQYLDSHHLLSIPKQKSKWGFPYTLPALMGSDTWGEELTLNALFYRMLLDMAELSEGLHLTNKKEEYLALAKQVREAINDRLWNSEEQCYWLFRDETSCHTERHQCGNALTVLYDIAGNKQWDKITKHSMNSLLDYPDSIWPNMVILLVEALFKAEKNDDAIRLLKKVWGYMLERGSQTCWEVLSLHKNVPAMNEKIETGEYPGLSFCHGWSAGPAYLLPAIMAGIRPTTPGFREFFIDPKWDAFETVKVVVPTPAGLIAAGICNQKSGKTIEIFVPAGCTGKLLVQKNWTVKVNTVSKSPSQTVALTGEGLFHIEIQ
jgi:hypothetical protein